MSNNPLDSVMWIENVECYLQNLLLILTDWRICPLLVSWTVQLSSMPGSSRPLCQTRTLPPWQNSLGAQSAAGVWLGLIATDCPPYWGLWMWTSFPTAGTTTTSGSQRTWSVLVLSWVGKTPVRWGTKLCVCTLYVLAYLVRTRISFNQQNEDITLQSH